MNEVGAASNRLLVSQEFHKSATHESAEQKRGRQKTPRITLRLSDEEDKRLRERAGDLSVSAYVRDCLFDEDTTRRKRRSYRPVADQQALAQALSLLGQSRMAGNLNQIAYHANCGSLDIDEATQSEIKEAAATIAWIRVTLIEALGLKNQDRP